jgi:hypothetical protein
VLFFLSDQRQLVEYVQHWVRGHFLPPMRFYQRELGFCMLVADMSRDECNSNKVRRGPMRSRRAGCSHRS